MIINSPAEFGAAVRNRRKQLHYTQAYVSEVTRGKETSELGKALLIANLLGLNCTLSVRGS